MGNILAVSPEKASTGPGGNTCVLVHQEKAGMGAGSGGQKEESLETFPQVKEIDLPPTVKQGNLQVDEATGWQIHCKYETNSSHICNILL